MAQFKYESMWKLMFQYSLNLPQPFTDISLICSVCNNIMIDACQSSCECRYCFQCINNYLQVGNKYCPGKKEECHKEPLRMEITLWRDISLNNKISKLRTVCPGELCNDEIELIEMKNHLRLCTKFTGEYLCNSLASNFQQCDHFYSQTQLWMESINNFKNEFEELKVDSNRNKVEINSLKEEVKSKDTLIKDLKKEIKNQRTEINSNKIEILNVKLELKSEKERVSILDEETKVIKTKVDLCSKNNENVESVNDNINELKNVLKDAIYSLESEKEELSVVRLEVKQRVDDIQKELQDVQKVRKTCKEDKERRNKWIKWNKLCPELDMDFVWIITNLSRKITNSLFTGIYSDDFYCGDVKFCLNVHVVANVIKIYCYIMKGENDDVLMWPMKRKVTLGIIDQSTLEFHESISFQYNTYSDKNAFNKPISKWNASFMAGDSFSPYSVLAAQSSIIVNDSIVISFLLED